MMIETNANKRTAKRVEKKNYDEMIVEIDPGNPYYRNCDNETRERRLTDWAEEVYDILRDHRSIDINDVSVVIPVFDACSACGREWETMVDEEVVCCASCGVVCAKSSS